MNADPRGDKDHLEVQSIKSSLSKPQNEVLTTSSATSGSPHGSRRGIVVSVTVATAAFLSGDVAMVAVCAVMKATLPGQLIVQWLVASSIIATGGFLLFGLPQLLAWRRPTPTSTAATGQPVRTRWAEQLLRSGTGGPVLFTVASIAGGPLAVGWHFGRVQHKHATALTALASLLMALAWAAAYLGLLGSWRT